MAAMFRSPGSHYYEGRVKKSLLRRGVVVIERLNLGYFSMSIKVDNSVSASFGITVRFSLLIPKEETICIRLLDNLVAGRAIKKATEISMSLG
ncbi:hypothetical protein A0U93_14505 [Neoasaia chiangmaiensis]|uniref:Uncharacterized protein n=1 Tax=Neoasaia chiangmaiensis TaxID=320497 RepID=A0A1U9KSY2_9PROT|nr:hypothetical protein A0U93_14505 [Neoasaia chiangmaiensis]